MGYIADLSKFQDKVDFAKLSKVADFVILRTQCGSTYPDPKYGEYVQGCKANNLPFGSYAYGKFVSISDAEKEAHDFLSRIDKATKFVVLDAEEMTVRDSHDLIPAIQHFIDICKQAGYKTGLYTGEYFLKNYGLSVIKSDFLWLAKYSSNKPSVDHHLWQYTDRGSLPGIATNVDLNLLGSKPLSFFTGGKAYKVIIPNTNFTQAKALVVEYQQKGYKCEGVNLKVYAPNQKPAETDPYWFVIYTDLDIAKQLVIELQTKGYGRTYGEEIK